ncbi:hypothetical protein [Microcoleus sp. B7-D4]|uniref:hypothetical protein n=1 Tax=Microcoleus sp. B7-D4 TaxID=2818696 RepID=UPI002FD4DA25
MDQLLRQLIEEVCEYPQNSSQRRKAMNRLLAELQELPGLRRSAHPDYLDALNKTWVWVNKSICSNFKLSDPNVSTRLRQWINSYLKWRIKDLKLPSEPPTYSLDALIGVSDTETALLDLLSETSFSTPTRSGLDGYIALLEQENYQNIIQQLEQYVQEDPDGKFRSCHPKNHPECNCQVLTLKVLFKTTPDKFTAIAKEFNINYQTLKSHWERNCRPLLQVIALELGYTRED